MDDLVIRDLSDGARKALEERAERHGQSPSDEVRDIVEAAVLPHRQIRAGALFAALGQEFGGIELSFERDRTPSERPSFD